MIWDEQAVKKLVDQAFDAGFEITGEGFNGEYGADRGNGRRRPTGTNDRRTRFMKVEIRPHIVPATVHTRAYALCSAKCPCLDFKDPGSLGMSKGICLAMNPNNPGPRSRWVSRTFDGSLQAQGVCLEQTTVHKYAR